MKRLVVITAMVTVCVGGVLRLQSAADEPEAPASVTEAAAETAAQVTQKSETWERKPGGAGPEAVIDVTRVFKADAGFEKRRQQLLKRSQTHRAQSQRQAEKLKKLSAELENLRAYRGGDALREKIQEREIQLVTTQAEFEARTKIYQQQMIHLESEMYAETYDRILQEVRQYAQEQGFRTVRRRSPHPPTQAARARQAAPAAVKSGAGVIHNMPKSVAQSDEGIDLVLHGTPISVAQSDKVINNVRISVAQTEVSPAASYQVPDAVRRDGSKIDHRAVLARINQDVLYTAGADNAVDITDAIIERLNAKSSSADEADSY